MFWLFGATKCLLSLLWPFSPPSGKGFCEIQCFSKLSTQTHPSVVHPLAVSFGMLMTGSSLGLSWFSS